MFFRALPLLAFGLVSTFASAHAASSTSRGEISVAQVMEMLDKASKETTARQVLVAYLAGVGETAGTLIKVAGPRAHCQGPISLDGRAANQALKVAARQGNTTEVAATPLIVDDMIKRAGCSLGN